MKKGEKRIRVDILKKTIVDGEEVKVKVGEKDIYETNPYSGSGAFNMSWADRNKMPRENSKRQTLLREAGKNKNVATAKDVAKLEKEIMVLEESKKLADSTLKTLESIETETSKPV